MPFPPSASCRNLDLPPVNLRFLQSHLTKNAFAIARTHLCGIAQEKRAQLSWARKSVGKLKPIPSRSSEERGLGGEGKDSHSRQWRLSMAVFLNRNKRPQAAPIEVAELLSEKPSLPPAFPTPSSLQEGARGRGLLYREAPSLAIFRYSFSGSPKYLAMRLARSRAFSFVGISQKMRRRGSVPLKRAMIQPSAKRTLQPSM